MAVDALYRERGPIQTAAAAKDDCRPDGRVTLKDQIQKEWLASTRASLIQRRRQTNGKAKSRQAAGECHAEVLAI